MSILFSPKTRQKTEKRVILSKKYVFLSIFLINLGSFVVKYAREHHKRHCHFPAFPHFFAPWPTRGGFIFSAGFWRAHGYASRAAKEGGIPVLQKSAHGWHPIFFDTD